MRRIAIWRAAALMASAAALSGAAPLAAQGRGARFEISFPASVHSQPITGRVYVFITTDSTPEPRFQGGALGANAPFFATDVSALAPGEEARIDSSTPGFPVERLTAIPAGDYWVQAVMNVYTQFHRADGHTIWAHMDQWEGQSFTTSPGNLISAPTRVHLDPRSGYTIPLSLTRVLPPVQVAPDTKWVKHVKIQSALLTKFWGHPMYLGAVVLLPKGYDTHPDVRYPVDYEQDHFSLAPPYHFQSAPATPVDSNVVGHRAWVVNLRRLEGYRLYRDWTSDDFPRMLMVTFLHPTPYFDDSYAVNSANNGPYGDAIMHELIPYIESHFRIIREPYARVLSGGSTGGWESLALQLYHPEFFGGAWIYYPDPVDFRQWALVNIYADSNAFTMPGAQWVVPDRPMMRNAAGQVLITERQQGQLESVLGTHGRSGEQQEAWEAVYGPVGDDGYPKPLWNKRTGTIDHSVATYMRQHGYDLRAYAQQHWTTIGPQLVGKLHVYVGDMDNFYLNMAVYRLQEFLESTLHPRAEASFSYGRPMKPHGIRPTSTGDMLRAMAAAMTRNAPAGANTDAWKYR
ncbi:MAG TPA: alpha/beta hydrolase-fold protein [Gemmatimonadaceae bacterium]|nr:alpha/beta hydrolase-fold protein [Gemmatimonadaceae bacterium]